MSNGRRWWRSLGPVVCALVAASCVAQPSDDLGGRASNPEPIFALGEKADGACSSGSSAELDLCWPSADQAAVRIIVDAEDRLLMGLGDPAVAAGDLLSGLDLLSARLHDDELAALPDLAEWITARPDDAPGTTTDWAVSFLDRAHRRVLDRVLGTFYAAHMVPIGSQAVAVAAPGDAGGMGKHDGSADADTLIFDDAELTTGMRESLEMIRETGILGQIYAFLFEHTGVLHDEHSVFDETFPYSEPREERVRRIIDHARLAAAGSAVVAGVEGLIPVAGLLVSIGHKQIMDFRNRARMVLELAALYGIDIRDGHNLVLVAAALLSAQDIPDLQRLVGASLVIRVIAAQSFRILAGDSAQQLVRTLLRFVITTLVGKIGLESAAFAAGRAAGEIAANVAKNVLGYATFGLLILADAAVTAHLVAETGENAANLLRPWGSDLPHEGAAHFTTAEGRECTALWLGELMWADGAIADGERSLLAAEIGRAYFRDGQWWRLQDSEAAALANMAASASTTDVAGRVDGCAERFRSLDSYDRLTLLSNAYLMTAVDGVIDPEEAAAYGRVERRLAEGRFLGRGHIREQHVDAMRHAIDVLMVERADWAAPENRVALSALTANQILPYLHAIDPEVASAVDRAFPTAD